MPIGQIHRKHAFAVGLENRPWCEVSPDGDNVSIGEPRIWKIESRRHRLDGHGPIVPEASDVCAS